jgi:hypothetical protein
MILYLKDTKISSKTPQDIISTLSRVARNKINLQKSVSFLNINNEQTGKEYRKTIPFTIVSKIIKRK